MLLASLYTMERHSKAGSRRASRQFHTLRRHNNSTQTQPTRNMRRPGTNNQLPITQLLFKMPLKLPQTATPSNRLHQSIRRPPSFIEVTSQTTKDIRRRRARIQIDNYKPPRWSNEKGTGLRKLANGTLAHIVWSPQ